MKRNKLITTLLLKTKQNYFNDCNSSILTERRDRERERHGLPAENSEKLQGSMFVPSFQLKVPRTKCEQIALSSSSRACEHLIYEIGYCYEDRR